VAVNKFVLLAFGLLVLGCQPRHVESSAERNQRELKAMNQTQLGAAVLQNRWCAFVDSASKFQFRGFLRLTFNADETLIVEEYAEDSGRPFGKLDDDKIGLWMLDGERLDLQIDKTRHVKFSASFGELNATPTMTLTDVSDPQMTALMWTCNGGVDDPIPVTINSDDPTPPPTPPTGDDD
jgi:hypothetical protein